MIQSQLKQILTIAIVLLTTCCCFAQKRDSSGHLTYNAVIEIAQKKGGRYFRKTDGWHARAVFDTTVQTWRVISTKETFHSRWFSQWDYRKTRWRVITIDDKTATVLCRKRTKRKQPMYPD